MACRGNPKHRRCMDCGADMGLGEFVEFRVINWYPEESGLMKLKRWRSRSMYGKQMCPTCAIAAVDRMLGKKGAS